MALRRENRGDVLEVQCQVIVDAEVIILVVKAWGLSTWSTKILSVIEFFFQGSGQAGTSQTRSGRYYVHHAALHDDSRHTGDHGR